MTGKEVKYVSQVIENEGFDYGCADYTDFKDTVTDPEFHRLRVMWEQARAAFRAYIGCDE